MDSGKAESETENLKQDESLISESSTTNVITLSSDSEAEASEDEDEVKSSESSPEIKKGNKVGNHSKDEIICISSSEEEYSDEEDEDVSLIPPPGAKDNLLIKDLGPGDHQNQSSKEQKNANSDLEILDKPVVTSENADVIVGMEEGSDPIDEVNHSSAQTENHKYSESPRDDIEDMNGIGDNGAAGHSSTLSASPPPSKNHKTTNGGVDVDAQDDSNSEEDEIRDPELEKKLDALDNAYVTNCVKIRKEVAEEEVDLDDDDNSTFIRMRKLEGVSFKTYKSGLNGAGFSIAGVKDPKKRKVKLPISLTEDNQTIQESLEKYVNSNISKQPNYRDILAEVKKVILQEELSSDASLIAIRIYEYLVKRNVCIRKQVLKEGLLRVDDTDPADTSPELAAKLAANKSLHTSESEVMAAAGLKRITGEMSDDIPDSDIGVASAGISSLQTSGGSKASPAKKSRLS